MFGRRSKPKIEDLDESVKSFVDNIGADAAIVLIAIPADSKRHRVVAMLKGKSLYLKQLVSETVEDDDEFREVLAQGTALGILGGLTDKKEKRTKSDKSSK